MDGTFQVEKLGTCEHDSPVELGFFVNDDRFVLVDATVKTNETDVCDRPVLELAGPRHRIYFDPAESRAAIVTCGGLCPGLNDVIRGLTMVLWTRYGVRQIMGIRYGYAGLVTSSPEPLALTIISLGASVLVLRRYRGVRPSTT